MENIKKKLSDAINQHGQFFMLNKPLNDEIIYQIIFDTYFKNLTVDDMKDIVNISYPTGPSRFDMDTRIASIYIKLIMHFTEDQRFDKLKCSLLDIV